MITFFDTSVLVAACQKQNEFHTTSLASFAQAHKDHSACGLHTLAEIYAAITGMNGKSRVPPGLAPLFIEQVRERCQIIALTPEQYWETIQTAAERHIAGGTIYDALLLACARKAKAGRILTWNLRQFKMIAPDLADRIMTPNG
ncbi:MAG: PIN domain-containing protein [Acidobacteriaceae bacterium]